MAAVGPKASLALSVFVYLLWIVNAAPVEESSSHALQISESYADGRGCYYNFEHYGEGDRILTNEPCLNCTCHNRMLMCYLRVCPFTKAIGQDCTVEKKPDQCCPIITCPQVPVALLTSSTTPETPPTTTALGRPDSYGCILEDNTFYADGAQVPSDPRKPCELCYCIRNHTACVMQECTLNVEGCKPVYQEGICCPVRYDCDYDDVATTPKPVIGLVTTPGGPSDCLHNGRIYSDGAMVMKDEKAPCEHCYCMRGDIVCAVPGCGTPLEGTDCIPLEPKKGQCCPNYKCANGTQSTGNSESYLSSSTESSLLYSTESEPSFSTEKLTQSSSMESGEIDKHESDESSNEESSNESSEVTQEESGSESSKPIAGEHETNMHTQETTSTHAPEQTSSNDYYTKQPETTEVITSEAPLLEHNDVQEAGDSISEATQEQDVTQIHEATQNHEENQEKEVVHEQEKEVVHEQEKEVVHEPEKEVQEPEKEVHEPEKEVHEPEKEVQEPEKEVHEPEKEVQEPEKEVHEPEKVVNEQEANQETEVKHEQGQETTPKQEEVVHELDITHEQETIPEKDAPHEQEVDSDKETTQKQEVNQETVVTPVQEENVEEEAPHEQEANQEKVESYGQEEIKEQATTPKQEQEPQGDEITQKPEINQEQEIHEQEPPLDQESHTQTPVEVVKNPQITNEIPESTPHEQTEHITEEPTIEVARVPGEGSCLLEGKTYAHNSDIPTENPCQKSCKCYSSIVTCKTKECPPAPTQFEHCMPVTTPGSCCPTYMCDQKPSDAPEAQNQLVEKNDDISHDDNPLAETPNEHVDSTESTIENEHKNEHTFAPVVEGIPPDNLHPGSYENVVPSEQPEESNQEPAIQTTEHTSTADISTSNNHEDEHVNSHVIHEMDAAIHGEHQEFENENIPHLPEGVTTIEPINPEVNKDESQELGTSQGIETTSSSIIEDNAAAQTDGIPIKQDSATVTPLDDELPQTPNYYTTSQKPSEEDSGQLTNNIGTENAEANQEFPETTNYDIPEVTTLHQEIQENNEQNIITAIDPQPDENNDYLTSTDSNLDESKHEENIVTSKPIEENIPQEPEGETYTDHHQLVTEGPTGIPHNIPEDGSHSHDNNDSVQTQTDQEHTTFSQQNIYPESVTETSSETIINSENVKPEDLSDHSGEASEVPGETQNVVVEETTSSVTSSPIQQDDVTNATQVSMVSVENEEVVSHSPEITDEVLNEISTTPSPEIINGTPDKLTEQTINQAPGETNDEMYHGLESTTNTLLPTIISHESMPNAPEKAQESEAQESNNVMSPSTEKPTSEYSTTVNTISNQEETETDEKLVGNTFPEIQISTEQTSEGAIHSGELESIPDIPNPTNEVIPVEEPTNESSGQEEAVTQRTQESDTETSTGVKSEEAVSHEPSEITVPSINQSEDGNSLQDNIHKESSPEVIFEEVTVTGMPSIESQVTEGAADHSIEHINNLPESDTLHTTEQNEPAKEQSLINEVQNSNLPNDSETTSSSSVTTVKTIEDQSTDETTSSYHKIPSIEDIPKQEINLHQDTITEVLPDKEESTTLPAIMEEPPYQEITSGNENSQVAYEVLSPVQPEASQQTTMTPENHEEANIGNEYNQITTISTTQTDDQIDNEQNEIQSPVSNDENNEIITSGQHSSEHSSEESPVHEGETSTELADEILVQETTASTSTESHSLVQQEVEDNSDENSVNNPYQTDAPLDVEKIIDHTEKTPSEVQPDVEGSSHVAQEDISITNEVISTDVPNISNTENGAVTNSPSELMHEVTQDISLLEPTIQPNQSETLQHETITETSLQNQPEKVPEDSSSGFNTTDINSVTVTEVTPEEVPNLSSSESPEVPNLSSSESPEVPNLSSSENQEVPNLSSSETPEVPYLSSSENPEVPITDNKEISHELPIEHLPETESQQNSTPPPLSIDTESSTSHIEVIPQTENIEPSSTNTPEENLQLSNGNDDSLVDIPQVIHLESVVPPAPNSESHLLETSETEGDTSTEATEETSMESQVSNSDHKQNIPENIPDEIPSNQVDTEQTESSKPVSEEDSNIPVTHVPHSTESSPESIDHESSSVSAEIQENLTTQRPFSASIDTDIPHSTEAHSSTEDSQTTIKETVTQKIETDPETPKPEDHVPVTEITEGVPILPEITQQHLNGDEQPTNQSSKVQTVSPSTETSILTELPSSTKKPFVHHEESPSFPTWSQKPFEHHTTPEPHPPEESHYPTGFDPEYEDEEGVSYGPGTCRYGGKVYLSAQQIPRDDPCDFCFCFRSDIICLQQSCPPPIRGCYQETIKGFCCPRYECHVSMATMVNITTTTTTTTTAVPPLFFAHAYNGAATKAGCQVKDVAYSVGERIPSTSGPCLECRCGANGQMKCDPTVCGPQEALLRQVMDAAVSRRR